jgi:hypothetical protein
MPVVVLVKVFTQLMNVYKWFGSAFKSLITSCLVESIVSSGSENVVSVDDLNLFVGEFEITYVILETLIRFTQSCAIDYQLMVLLWTRVHKQERFIALLMLVTENPRFCNLIIKSLPLWKTFVVYVYHPLLTD